jgi:hypothetical protein
MIGPTHESPIIEYSPIKADYNTKNYSTLVAAVKKEAAELGNALLLVIGNF